MAKSKYPLMCETARGIFGRQLVYREVKGIPVVSIFRPATDRKTPAQLEMRNAFRYIASVWNTHTQEEKDTLKPYVIGKNLTTYDYYTKKFFETGEDPLGPPPVPELLLISDITNAHIPITIAGEEITYIFFALAVGITFGTIRDPENIYIDIADWPEPTYLAIGTSPLPEGYIIPDGYEIVIDTDIISNFHIRFPETHGPQDYMFVVVDDGTLIQIYP